MNKYYCGFLLLATTVLTALLPDIVQAAGGPAEMLVVVADSRRVQGGIVRYFVDSYNTNPLWFGIECTVITAAMGVTFGLATDFVMKRIGIDLTSRKIVEH
ncbi:MAG: hypothetical protein PHS86_12045 [Syntrophaceae bacterium]|nr:hypothetical protein [Syntrophaceae bacterium]